MAKRTKLGRGIIALIVMPVLCVMIAISGIALDMTASADVTKTVKHKFTADYTSYEESFEAGSRLNVEIAEEGSVLLKNNDDTLPVARNSTVSVFGRSSYNIVTGGGGSGSGSGVANTLKESLTAAGLKTNSVLADLYGRSEKELAPSELAVAQESYGQFGDVALITIARTGSEGGDLAMQNVDGHADKKDHYLELTDSEEALIAHVSNNFGRIVVLINSSNAMELGALEMNDKIDAILWIGHTGNTGIMAVGKILTGEVNPSGRLVDTYNADFKTDPTWYNFGYNTQVGADNFVRDKNGNKLYSSFYDSQDEKQDSYAYTTLNYQEGIYVGYRYFETAYEVIKKKSGDSAADNWYNAWKSSTDKATGTGVVYPFGYGLSYTKFDWKIKSVKVGEAAVSSPVGSTTTLAAPDANEKMQDVTVTVVVTNTGDVAGKDVVELYYSAPYTGNIERSAVDLLAFAKTDVIPAGGTDTVTLTFNARDMQAFDYEGKVNTNKGYAMEDGDYVLSVRSDSHTVKNDLTFTLKTEANYSFNTDKDTGNTVEAEFSKDDAFNSVGYYDTDDVSKQQKVLNPITRANFPTTVESLEQLAPDTATRKFNDGLCALIDEYTKYDPSMDATASIDDWNVTTAQIPAGWTQAASETDEKFRNADKTVKKPLITMAGVDFKPFYNVETYNADTSENAKAWEEFMNQLTLAEMIDIVSVTRDGNMAHPTIGQPFISHNDGPAQLKGRSHSIGDGIFWCSEVVIASTWNVELAEKQGIQVGNDSLFINVTGWWGPGANTHRSPFGGRNFEYYSSDGIQGGKIAAAVIRGAASKGCITYLKHFALNDQETNRNTNRGIATWATEQAIRDIYLKPFELAVKEGGTLGLMSSFNRIGAISAAGNYRLLNTIPRGEWNFKGVYITDMYFDVRVPGDACVRAGNDVPLALYLPNYGTIDETWDASKRNGQGNAVYNGEESATGYFAIRAAAQRMLYVMVNGNGMKNGLDIASFGADKELTAKAGESYSKSLALEGASVSDVAVLSGEIPEGMAISATGVLSGTPTKAGTYKFTAQLTGDYWMRSEAQEFTFTVENTQTYAGDMTATVGGAYRAVVTNKTLADKSTAGMDYEITGNLPEGVSYEKEDGELVIFGTPVKAGEYTFTVATIGLTTEVGHWGNVNTIRSYVYSDYTIVVGDAPAVTPKCTVTFNANGGSEVASQTLDVGATAAVPTAPAREGYTFTGWYLDEACTVTASFQNGIAADTTYYAGWSRLESDLAAAGAMATVCLVIAIVAVLAGGAGIALAILFKKK